MRTFEHFLQRRKIKDVPNWLKSMGIASDEQLAAWCKSESIAVPPTQYFSKVRKSVPKSTKEEIWHTPAAERSRKISRPKRKSKAPSKSSKKSS
jgi:hypothetical protein